MKQGSQIEFYIQQWMTEDCWWYETRKPTGALHPAMDDRGLLMIWNKEAKYSSTSSNGWQRTADDMKQGSQIEFYIQQRMTEDCWWYETRTPNTVLHSATDDRGLLMIWNKEAKYSSAFSNGWQRTADDMKQGSQIEFYIQQWMTEDCWWYETRKPNRVLHQQWMTEDWWWYETGKPNTVLHPTLDDRGLLMIWNKEAK